MAAKTAGLGRGDTLGSRFRAAAAKHAERTAVEEPPEWSASYAALDALSDRCCAWMQARGIGRGDRVAIQMPKTIDAVAAVLGVLKAGAAYVPVDAAAPAWRAAWIMADCTVRAAVLTDTLATILGPELAALGAAPILLRLDAPGAGAALDAALGSCGPPRPVDADTDDVAYLLYTSGSTGTPKGVVHSHRNALAFVDWCTATFGPTPVDRFSSHAPFHFDLSILDLYVPLTHGACVVLVSADAGKEPAGMAALMAERRMTVWYSTPSVLSLLTQYGHLERYQFPALRAVLFAGEVFPVKHLRALTRAVPHPRYYNLYGPTETNVCTWHEVVRPVADDLAAPCPIGVVCDNYRARVVDPGDADVAPGAEGELVIAGTGVMLGYWNLPERSAEAFLVAPDGTRWYRTGDIVTEESGAVYRYVGRRDRMVKRRGHRVELGEVEAGLYRHPDVREAAVVALPDPEAGVRLRAVVALHPRRETGVVALKHFCAEVLPAAMIPDVFVFVDALPKTSTDKIDYQKLAALP